eukprot:429624-Amphidinium_carterae.2
MQFFGQVGQKPDLLASAKEYRQAMADKSAAYMEAARMGKIATVRSKLGLAHAGQTAFGASARSLCRNMLRNAKVALLQSSHGESLLQQANALAERAELAEMPLSVALTHARELVKSATRQRQTEIDKMRKELDSFGLGPGQQQLQHIKSIAPTLFQGMSHITAVPSGLGLHIQMQAGNAEVAGKAVAWASAAEKTTNLCQSLDHSWSMLHKQILHEDCPELVDNNCHNPCQLAGRCLCSAHGQTLMKMKLQLHRLLKASCMLPLDKHKLGNGMLVLQVTSNSNIDGSGSDLVELWFHIGLVYYRPYRVTLHELSKCSWQEEADDDLGRIVLQAERLFLTPRILLVHGSPLHPKETKHTCLFQ